MSEGASTANARRLPLMEAFQTVKDKLACNEHPGENQWCWIDNPTTRGGDAVHIPLCLHDIQMWAQYLLTHSADTAFTSLPNIGHFNKMHKTREPRSTTIHRTPTEPVICKLDQDYKTHIIPTDGINYNHTDKPHTRGLTCEYAFILDSDDI